MGDERGYSYVKTPEENTLADQAMQAALFGKKFKVIVFYLGGSDERQYCSRNRFTGSFSKSYKYFKEYHTNKDNFGCGYTKGFCKTLLIF